MPVSPAPVLPGTSPLPPSGQQPPSRRALRLGALIALPLLVVGLVVGQLALPTALFLVPGLQAQAGTNLGGTGGINFQGFVYSWTRRETDANSGYMAPVSLQNMQSEASVFHMNAVIIPVVADMPERSERYIAFHNTDKSDLDTLPVSNYIRAIQDARKAGLLPILELQMLQQDQVFAPNESSANIGTGWSENPSSQAINDEEQQPNTVKTLERTWFDNYTAFAVEYAQLSQQYHLPYFIFGDGLTNVSYDTPQTNAQTDPGGIPRDSACPQEKIGRRDCEWRHVISAIRSQSYQELWTGKQQTGGSYTGKLIYAANWDGASDGAATTAEFEGITWWDAVDYIGINAGFPLTDKQRDPSLNQLTQAWHGQGSSLGGQNDIYSRIQKVAEKYDKPVIFTSAGYNSVGGANSLAFQSTDVTPTEDDGEQYNDMQALLQTFSTAPWWVGVFWEGDAPIPRDQQPNWSVTTAWAGPTLATSKSAGQWLAQYYKPAPIPCSC